MAPTPSTSSLVAVTSQRGRLQLCSSPVSSTWSTATSPLEPALLTPTPAGAIVSSAAPPRCAERLQLP
eukprot:2688198-Pyramimonas_sp.AAC.1